MNPLYNLAMVAYDGAIKLVSGRNPKAKKIVDGRARTLDILKEKLSPGDRPIWFHAASLGEFEQARPIIEGIKRVDPGNKIVVSFFSPSGYEVRKDYRFADAVVYLPADTPARMREFIAQMDPSLAVFVKYEFWRNALETLSHRGVPTILICALFRPDQLFFKPWGRFYRRWLRWFTQIFVQNEKSRSLLEEIGIHEVTVAGDTRFDRVAAIRDSRKAISEAEAFCAPVRKDGAGKGMVMVAGSSWPQDEAVYCSWVKEHPEVKLIVAPHEFDDARIGKLIGLFGEDRAVALSRVKGDAVKLAAAQVLVVDCFGLLSSLYAYADVAYVGGGFGVSIHNINEAAVYGIPVMFGPNNRKFLEAQELKANGGGIEVSGRSDFEARATELLEDKEARGKSARAAGAYIQSKLGATQKILAYLGQQ